MFEIKNTDKTWEVKLNTDEDINELLSSRVPKMDIEAILSESKMTQEQADELAKEVKASYWQNNKDWILKRIGK